MLIYCSNIGKINSKFQRNNATIQQCNHSDRKCFLLSLKKNNLLLQKLLYSAGAIVKNLAPNVNLS